MLVDQFEISGLNQIFKPESSCTDNQYWRGLSRKYYLLIMATLGHGCADSLAHTT